MQTPHEPNLTKEIAEAVAEVNAAPKTKLLRNTEEVVETIGDDTPQDERVLDSPIDAALNNVAEANASSETAAEVVETEKAIEAKPEVAAVEFSPEGGVHRSSVTLVLSCATPEATIRYTTDGSEVNEGSSVYHEPQLLTQTTSVAARAFVDEKTGPLSTCHYDVLKAVWQEREPEVQSDVVTHRASDAASLPDGWKLGVGSVRGKLHAHRANWREDSFAHGVAGDWSINIVSDGAGSAALSRVGSRLACEYSLAHLQTALADFHLQGTNESELKNLDLPQLRATLITAAQDALNALHEEAERREKPLADFAATLLILLRAPWNNSQLCAALQVGDGAMALLNENDLTILGVADHGEHSSETRFLTTRDVEHELGGRVLFSIKPDLRAIAVMTDGVSDDFFPEAQRLGEVFDAVLPLLESSQDAGATLLDWLSYEKKGSSDDRTLLISWKA